MAEDITQLLLKWNDGDNTALDQLMHNKNINTKISAVTHKHRCLTLENPKRTITLYINRGSNNAQGYLVFMGFYEAFCKLWLYKKLSFF